MSIPFIHESPNKGKTITRRPFGSDPSQKETIKRIDKKSDREYLNTVLEYVLSHAGDSQANLASKAARDHIIKEINSMLDR